MSYEVDKLMSSYSNLSEEDQKEFDKRYKDSQQFKRALTGIVKEFSKRNKEKQQAGQ